MNKYILFFLSAACLVDCPLRASVQEKLPALVGAAVVCGVGYVAGYKAWQLYRTYSNKRAFEKACLLLKQASFWGHSPTTHDASGYEIISAINQVASQGYTPALYFQAEHPWLFVDGIVSEYAPGIQPSVFYNRYARYSIEKYLSLALAGDDEAYFKAGTLGIAWLYTRYTHGASYEQLSAEITEYIGYLDAAASLGNQAAVREIIRLYKEGLLVMYNARILAELPTYYHTIQTINATYPFGLRAVNVWLYKNYYRLFNQAPVPYHP